VSLPVLSVRTDRKGQVRKLTWYPFPALFLKKKKAMGQVRKPWLRIAQQLLRYAQPWFDPKDPTIVRSGGSNHASKAVYYI